MESAGAEYGIGKLGAQVGDNLLGPGIGRGKKADTDYVRIECEDSRRDIGKENIVVNQLHLEAGFFKDRADCQDPKRWNQVVCLANLDVDE